VSVVKGWSNIFFNEAPLPPPTLLEFSPLRFALVTGGFEARTGEAIPFEVLFSLSLAARRDALFCCVAPVPVVRLVRLGPESEDEGRDFAKVLAVGARRVEEERFTPVLPVTRPVPILPLLLTLLTRLLAVPSVLDTPRSSESRFLWTMES
jgi:hypothetical protein